MELICDERPAIIIIFYRLLFCMLRIVVLFSFSLPWKKESEEIVENKKTINIYVYVYMILRCIYIIV